MICISLHQYRYVAEICRNWEYLVDFGEINFCRVGVRSLCWIMVDWNNYILVPCICRIIGVNELVCIDVTSVCVHQSFSMILCFFGQMFMTVVYLLCPVEYIDLESHLYARTHTHIHSHRCVKWRANIKPLHVAWNTLIMVNL